MKNKHRYAVKIRWSKKDDCYVASAPALEKLGMLCGGHGNTRLDALLELEIGVGFAAMEEMDGKIHNDEE